MPVKSKGNYFIVKTAAAVFVAGVLFFNWAAAPCLAGQLGAFEKAATQNKESTPEDKEQEAGKRDRDHEKDKSDKHDRDHEKDESDKHDRDHEKDESSPDDSGASSVFGKMLGDIFVFVVIYPGKMTLARVYRSTGSESAELEMREKGSPELPILRADLNYQRVSSHISGIDGRILAGYGPFGLQYRQTHYREDAPKSTLDLTQIHGLYRISFSKKFEFGLGFGSVILHGQERSSGFSTTYPINFFPVEHLGINITPTWNKIHGAMVSDFDESVSYVWKYYSARLGYRHIRAGDSVLAGPYLGVSCYY